jgi:hypothetical protein
MRRLISVFVFVILVFVGSSTLFAQYDVEVVRGSVLIRNDVVDTNQESYILIAIDAMGKTPTTDGSIDSLWLARTKRPPSEVVNLILNDAMLTVTDHRSLTLSALADGSVYFDLAVGGSAIARNTYSADVRFDFGPISGLVRYQKVFVLCLEQVFALEQF